MSDEPIKPCPCGKVPDRIWSTANPDGADKWAYASGSCCGEWATEYRNQYATGDEATRLATEAWNRAARGQEKP